MDAEPLPAMEADADVEVKDGDIKPVTVEELLKMKITLRDGSEAFIFSYGPPRLGETNRSIYCHLCRRESVTQKRKELHITLHHHKRILRKLNSIKPESYNKPAQQYYGRNEEGKFLFFAIWPGENIEEVTDEYKDRITLEHPRYYARPSKEDFEILKVENLYAYNGKHPLLGLAYIFKMRSDERVKYHCALCDEEINGEAFVHIVSAAHQTNYIIKHFPKLYATVNERLKVIKNEAAAEQTMCNIFRCFYRKIENLRRKPRVRIVDFEHFQKNRNEIVKECRKETHFDENTLRFDEEYVNTIIKNALDGKEIIKPDLKSLEKPELGPQTLIPIELKNSDPNGKYEPPQKITIQDCRNPKPETYAAYRLMLSNRLDDINAKYKKYETNPKSHPQFYNVWRFFLRQRGQKVKKGKIGWQVDDFKLEFTPLWLERLHQLYAKDVASCKRELKKFFHLPSDRSPSPVDQIDEQMQPEGRESQPQSQSSQPPNMNQDRSTHAFEEDGSIVSSEPLSIISVIGLLSALEDQLGSLGPKAVELLSKAVLCEKNNGDADELLLDNDCYVLFASAKEKFRGQLQANLIDPVKIKAVSHCVNELSAILQIMRRAQAKEQECERKEEEKLKQQQVAQTQSWNTYATDKNNSFYESGGNITARVRIDNNPPTNQIGRKRKTTENIVSGGNISTWVGGSNLGGSDNLGKHFSCGRNDSVDNFDSGNGFEMNFSSGSRSDSDNFGNGGSFSGNFDRKSDKFNKNLGSESDRWGNFGSLLNDMGGSFSGGSNNGVKRNKGGGNKGKYNNFGSGNSFISGGRKDFGLGPNRKPNWF